VDSRCQGKASGCANRELLEMGREKKGQPQRLRRKPDPETWSSFSINRCVEKFRPQMSSVLHQD